MLSKIEKLSYLQHNNPEYQPFQSEKIYAEISIKLFCDCPLCGRRVDLLESENNDHLLELIYGEHHLSFESECPMCERQIAFKGIL